MGYSSNCINYPLKVEFENNYKEKDDSIELYLSTGELMCFGRSKDEVINLMLKEIEILRSELKLVVEYLNDINANKC